MYKLVIADDEGKTTVVPLVRDEITIGRKEGNTIRLTERNVSRRHARLRKVGGRFVLEDLGSYNGVRVNGERLSEPRPLVGGDKVAIGDYVLAVEAEGVDAASDEQEVDVAVDAVADPVPPPRLVMLSAPAAGAEFALQKGGMRIGRAEDLEIWVNHKSISREHARIEKDGDRIEILDLGSANGVRLNGKEIQRADLVAGDIVELGEVQFRFVEKGEAYTFDPATARKEALANLEAPSRLPLYLAFAVLAIALAAAAAIAFSGKDEALSPSAAPPPVAAAPATVATVAAEPEAHPAEAAAALARCEAGLASQQWVEAEAQANRARALDPSLEAARLCGEAARAQRGAEEQYAEGVRALDAGDFDAAHAALGTLPSYSPRHGAPEVARATRGYVDRHLQLARRARANDPAEAAREARLVLAVEGLEGPEVAEAQRILAQVERRGVAPSPPRPTAAPAPAPEPEGDAPVEAAPAYGLEVARACLRRGDNACVVAALDGHADSPAALALLIETLRTTGDDAAARRHMAAFVARYPTDWRAPGYRQVLGPSGP